MVLYILTGYRVLGIVYLYQLSGACHTHISYHNKYTRITGLDYIIMGEFTSGITIVTKCFCSLSDRSQGESTRAAAAVLHRIDPSYHFEEWLSRNVDAAVTETCPLQVAKKMTSLKGFRTTMTSSRRKSTCLFTTVTSKVGQAVKWKKWKTDENQGWVI